MEVGSSRETKPLQRSELMFKSWLRETPTFCIEHALNIFWNDLMRNTNAINFQIFLFHLIKKSINLVFIEIILVFLNFIFETNKI